jgi:Uncharacterized conserved protein (DUF2285)
MRRTIIRGNQGLPAAARQRNWLHQPVVAETLIPGASMLTLSVPGSCMAPSSEHPIADAPPDDPAITGYDRDHLKLYMRLLDAETAGASLSEVAPRLLGIDAEAEPERARRVHDNHLRRARWMTEHGYHDLLKRGIPNDAP